MIGRLGVALFMVWCALAAPATPPKQRLIVLTDIEAEADDSQSLVRLLLYSDEIDIEGLIATTSAHMRDTVHPESIRHTIAAYAQVRPNLLKHEPAFPPAASLLARVSVGQPSYGMAAVGAGKDTPGSRRIIQALDAPDPRPLWVSIWGGPNTLAQALYTLRATRSPAELKRLIAKLRVYAISDQDDSGAWLRRSFPDLFYIVSPGGYTHATWGGIMQPVDGIDNRTIGNDWLAANIQQGHGPLGAAYPDVAYGMEGDTPSFLALIPNGLSVPEHPEWGGWGGRYELYTPALADLDPNGFTGGVPVEAETRPIWTNAADSYTPYVASAYRRAVKPGPASFKDNRATLWRWRDDFQNDFAARIGWTTLPYARANHPPVPRLAHPDHLSVRSGETVMLDASGTSDPDGDSLSYLWFPYPEATGWTRPIALQGAENMRRALFRAPDVSRAETVHFILRVTDKGTPPLSRYKRVIVTILPRQ
jgi:hypothetical protein